LRSDDIKDELARDRAVSLVGKAREAGQAVADATAYSRVTAG